MAHIDVDIGPMRPEHVTQLGPVVAAAFSGEPFTTGMYGPSRIGRYRRLLGDYGAFPAETQDTVVATCGGVVISLATMDRPGGCQLCAGEQADLAHDADVAAEIEHEFERRCRSAHRSAALPSGHARITTVATQPFLTGEGIGRLVVSALVDHAWSLGSPCIALECLTSRRAFYERLGFESAVEFDDPGGPGLRSLLMVADRPR